jgi:peroxiredoxin Q/BCP
MLRKLLALLHLQGHGTMLEVGTQAPDFTVVDHHGKPVSLRDFRGKTVVLWFFPKADTPG